MVEVLEEDVSMEAQKRKGGEHGFYIMGLMVSFVTLT